MWNNNTLPLSCHGEITLSKTDEMYPIAIPNHISTISMHISSWVKIHWDLLKLLSWKKNIDVLWVDNSVTNWWNCPLAILNQISKIAKHIPSLVKIHWFLFKLSSGTQNIDVLRADNSVKINETTISNQISTISMHILLLIYTQIIVRKRKIRCVMGR